jgi:hypothetical protein
MHWSKMNTYSHWKLLRVTFCIILILVVVDSSFALSLLSKQLTISSQGTVSTSSVTTLPLHTDGILIKNSLNQTVCLRGVNWLETGFTISCTGDWYRNGQYMWENAYTHWDATGIEQRLQELQNYGFNTVRHCIDNSWWKNDAATTMGGETTDVHIRDAIMRTVQASAAHGIYCILGFDWGDSFRNTTDYVNTWTTIAQTYGAQPNVIFELWGETVINYNTWLTATQQAVAAIRQYSSNLCTIQYGFCGGMDFVDDIAPLVQSYGNIVYDQHIYRYPAGATFANNEAYDETFVRNKLLNTWSYTSVVGKYPFLSSEIGAWQGAVGSTYHEGEWFKSLLNVLNGWGAGYTYWAWGQLGIGWDIQIDDGASPYPLNQQGQDLVNAVAAGHP